jgi:hypothetical protein
VAGHLKILLEKDPGNTEKNHEKTEPEYSVTGS